MNPLQNSIIMKPQDIILQKPYLAWYVKDPKKLSDASVLEHVLNFGNWGDVKEFIQIKGIKETAQIFTQSIKRPRSNYSPEVEQYFRNYFERYVH